MTRTYILDAIPHRDEGLARMAVLSEAARKAGVAPQGDLREWIMDDVKAADAFVFIMPHALGNGSPVEAILEGMTQLLKTPVERLGGTVKDYFDYVTVLEEWLVSALIELRDLTSAVDGNPAGRIAPTAPAAAIPDRQEKPALRDAVEKLTDAAPVQSQPKAKGAGHAGA